MQLGGLKLLLPLTKSKDVDVQRLAVHALANLSVDGESHVQVETRRHIFIYQRGAYTGNAFISCVELLKNIPSVLVQWHPLTRGDKYLLLCYACIMPLRAFFCRSVYAAENQELMAQEGGIDMLVVLLSSNHPHLQRQASKALANLGVNANNKERICHAGGVGPLVNLAHSKSPGVAVEAVAALANLAVNGESIRGANMTQRDISVVGSMCLARACGLFILCAP